MNSETKKLVLKNGVRIEYVEQGRGPALVLLHGYSDSYRSYDLLRPLLPPGMRMIAMSMRGHGRSDAPGYYGMGDMAEDVIGLMNALEIERAIIVGHSLGSSVALAVGALYPTRVAGLALLGAFANYDENPGVQELTREVLRFREPLDPAFTRAFQESTLANPTPPGFLDMAVAESDLLSARTWKGIAEGFMAFDPLAAAFRCQAPALILWGDQDAFVPRQDMLKLAAAMPSARLFTLRGVGHALHWEKPTDIALRLCAFVAEIEDAAEVARVA